MRSLGSWENLQLRPYLTLQRGSLEQAFMQMTGDSVQYHAHDEVAAVTQLDAPTATEVAAGPKEDN